MIHLNLRLHKNTEKQAPLNTPLLIWQPAVTPVNVTNLFGRMPSRFRAWNSEQGLGVPIEEATHVFFIPDRERLYAIWDYWYLTAAAFKTERFLWAQYPKEAHIEMLDYLRIVADAPDVEYSVLKDEPEGDSDE